MAATHDLRESPPVAAPTTAPPRPEALPLLPAAAILALQRTAGNQAVVARLEGEAAPKLRTALDSKLVVTAVTGGYSAALEVGGESVAVAGYEPKGETELNRMPVYLEDIVSGTEGVVNVRYDPAKADVKAAFTTREVGGVHVTVKLLPQTAEALTATSAPAAKQVGADGANVDGKETVTTHSGASATDKIMGSIASAEGGFASVEGSDAGVLTWGQGQWTVTAGELQKVLAFIKDRRRDLFDRYWGSADLDVDGTSFVHDGKKWGPAKATMMDLFRPDLETIKAWANRFGQAGMDPQIQRLQREYLRGEVHETLGKTIGGHTPETVLDTRGQAYFYSMDKNLPAGARANFAAALKQVPLAEGVQVTDAQKTQLSDALGELFRTSSVVAFDNTKHHVIAFWGEGGRTRALDQADEAIAAGGDAKWSVAQWQTHRGRMAARVSRYSKTRDDIDAAIAHQEIEPDVPEGAFSDSSGGLVGSVAAGLNALADDAATALALAATGTGITELRISASVGNGGKNAAADVAAVCARMLGVGHPPGANLTELAAAIAHYQQDVVGMPHPDGRIDPGGRTIAALRAGTASAPAAVGAGHGTLPAGAAHASAGVGSGTASLPVGGAAGGSVGAPSHGTLPAGGAHATAGVGSGTASLPAGAAPAAHAAAPAAAADTAHAAPPAAAAHAAAAAPPTLAGPRPALNDSALEALVVASHTPAVQAAATDLAALETAFKGLKRNDANEELGQGRDDLVAGFRALRAKVAVLEPALQPHFYRAMNTLSPYYYQGLNIILEFDRKDKVTGKITHVWNTCNITSLSMTLEALGKTAADYKHPELMPAIAKVFKKDIDDKASGKVGSELAGLRLPDYVAMAAIAWQMGYKAGDEKAILKGGNDAFNAIPSAGAIATLAGDFGVTATQGALTLNASGRRDNTADALDSYGQTHWKAADDQATKETTDAKRAANAGKLSNAEIERNVPLERYKQSAIAQVGAKLDAGQQVVVGQWHHFVRLQGLTDEFVIKDDPGHYTGANEKATWEEARAMGLFLNWIVIG